jgi:transcriptional regulator with PAS, ATPase and Fis domain
MTTTLRIVSDPDAADGPFHGMIGNHPRMLHLYGDIRHAAPLDSPVLVEGATGTGKELVARAIHDLSRVPGPLIAVNVAELSETLAESELFGAVRGAYTGAASDRRGLVQAAAGGTLFLDEAGDLSVGLQAKLLRVLETGRVRQLGAAGDRQVQFRLLVSVQRPAAHLLADGRWRADFYYRVAGINLQVPPLFERLSDLPALTGHFLRELGRLPLSAGDLEPLEAYDWPGNVRELRRVLERAVHQARGGRVDADALARALRPSALAQLPARTGTTVMRLRDVEREHITGVLRQVDGDARAAAALLGLSRSSLYRRLEILGLQARPR